MRSLLRALPVFLVLAACAGAPESEPIGQTAEALDTYPNEQPAFDYFLAKGLTPVQSAGIVGNLDVESGVDPTIAQAGGPGRGIAQWSVGARWDTTKSDNVKDYAAQQGQSQTSLQLQLAFTWYELTTFSAYGLARLKGTTDVAGATTAFAQDFEGCGSCATSTRIAHAQSVLDRFGADAPDGSASSSSGGPTGPACTIDNGDTGVCISTSECAAQANHIASAGFCPGAADIQCCTSTGGGGGSASSSSSSSSGSSGTTSSSGDNSSNHAASQDASGCSSSPRPATAPGAWGFLLAGLAVFARRRHARGA